MIQQEKQLLLKVLCAELPYGVKAQVMGWDEEKGKEVFVPVNVYSVNTDGYVYFADNDYDIAYCSIDACRLYLRPLSSMTKEEREEIEIFIFNKWYEEDSCKIDKEGWIEILANYDVSGIDPGFCSDYVDWLLEHHFDYRGLIPMGLALEAKEEMYKTS